MKSQARWTSKLPPNLKCHKAKTAAITLLHNSNYEAGHLQKHSQSLIKYILIKKYAKTIREKIIKLVVKGYTYFPLTWNFMNKAHNEVKVKVKQKLLFIYFSLLAWFWGRTASRVYFYTILINIIYLWPCIFLSKSGLQMFTTVVMRIFSREATTLGKLPVTQTSNPRAETGFQNLIQTIRLTPSMILQPQQACSFKPPALYVKCFPFSLNGTLLHPLWNSPSFLGCVPASPRRLIKKESLMLYYIYSRTCPFPTRLYLFEYEDPAFGFSPFFSDTHRFLGNAQ